MSAPPLRLSGVVLDCPDPRVLATFYERLLGWSREQDGPTWVTLRAPRGGVGLSFMAEPAYVAPTWPAGPGDLPMMVHLDIEVDDLEGAVVHAERVGATVADYQPQDDVRVCLDPVGHPFCLFLPGV
ncbi:MAG: glyoxalase [Friedmanniella sp.]|nr:glyoxalase [Friedmanniella sp.]